jgi:hypothetical protein
MRSLLLATETEVTATDFDSRTDITDLETDREGGAGGGYEGGAVGDEERREKMAAGMIQLAFRKHSTRRRKLRRKGVAGEQGGASGAHAGVRGLTPGGLGSVEEIVKEGVDRDGATIVVGPPGDDDSDVDEDVKKDVKKVVKKAEKAALKITSSIRSLKGEASRAKPQGEASAAGKRKKQRDGEEVEANDAAKPAAGRGPASAAETNAAAERSSGASDERSSGPGALDERSADDAVPLDGLASGIPDARGGDPSADGSDFGAGDPAREETRRRIDDLRNRAANLQREIKISRAIPGAPPRFSGHGGWPRRRQPAGDIMELVKVSGLAGSQHRLEALEKMEKAGRVASHLHERDGRDARGRRSNQGSPARKPRAGSRDEDTTSGRGGGGAKPGSVTDPDGTRDGAPSEDALVSDARSEEDAEDPEEEDSDDEEPHSALRRPSSGPSASARRSGAKPGSKMKNPAPGSDNEEEEDAKVAVSRIQAIVRSRRAREQYLRLRSVTVSLQERVAARARGDAGADEDDDDMEVDDDEEEEEEEEEGVGGGGM